MVTIPKSRAIKAVLDLEYLKVSLKENQLLKEDTSRFSMIISQKDSIISIMNSEKTILNAVINDKTQQTVLLNDIIAKNKKSAFWLKLERNALIVALVLGAGYRMLHK